jgi:uncharacterized protein
MQCPNDQTPLAMTDRQGIEIDYCPTCRGIWLDRGELDKLIANSESSAQQAPSPAPQRYEEPRYQQPPQQHQQPYYDNDHNYKKKHKKESFLGDLFDF